MSNSILSTSTSSSIAIVKKIDEATADILLSFLEIAIHAILHTRHVYPDAVFERRKAYGIVTFMSRHPQINTYIHTMLTNVRPLLLRNSIEAIVLLLSDEETAEPREQYIFSTSMLTQNEQQPATLSDVESICASTILRIFMLEGSLPSLPTSSPTTFTLFIRSHELLMGPNSRGAYETLINQTQNNYHPTVGITTTATTTTHTPLPPWTPGIIGHIAHSTLNTSSTTTNSGGFIQGANIWARINSNDIDLDLDKKTKLDKEQKKVIVRPIKNINTGSLILDLRVEYCKMKERNT